jgi:hypothetical protein
MKLGPRRASGTNGCKKITIGKVKGRVGANADPQLDGDGRRNLSELSLTHECCLKKANGNESFLPAATIRAMVRGLIVSLWLLLSVHSGAR